MTDRIDLPPGFTILNGLMWPTFDEKCGRVVFGMARDLDNVMRYIPPNGTPRGDQRHVAVQAGGNCGVFPRALAKMFETVYTFEPDPENFTALVYNTAELKNVIRLQAALGDEHGRTGLALADHEPNNCGAYFLAGQGPIPVLRIDDLILPDCNLIYLDIEGYELRALRGARATIDKFHPVIALEDKGLSEQYGTKQGAVISYLESQHQYVVLERVHKDVILGYASDFIDIG